MIEVQSSHPEHSGESRSDWYVLANMPLRDGYDREALSRYDDDCWDLSPAVFRENARRYDCTVRFNTLQDPAMAAAMRE